MLAAQRASNDLRNRGDLKGLSWLCKIKEATGIKMEELFSIAIDSIANSFALPIVFTVIVIFGFSLVCINGIFRGKPTYT